MPIDLKNKNYKLSFFLYFLIFGLLIELITVGIVYTLNYFEMLEQLRSKYKVESTIKQNLLKDATKKVEKSINGILKNQIFLNYLESPSPTNHQAIEYLFYFISKENSSYMQVRYLDKNGQEIIRVDRANKKTTPIESSDLQSKAQRYYFQETMSAKPDKFWYSNLDLNVENNQIEIPHKPTLRIAKQVIYKNNTQGIIIINLAMQGFLEQLTTSSNFDIDLIDKDGDYIYSHNSKNSWSKDLKSGKNIKNSLNLTSLKQGSFEENNAFFVQIDTVIQSSQKPYLVFAEKHEIVQSLKKRNFYVTLWVIFIVLAVSIPIALFISSIPLTLQKRLSEALQQLQKFSNIVDKYVMTIALDSKKNIKSLSTAFANKVLYEKEELIGKNYSLIAQASLEEEGKLSEKDLKGKNMVIATKKGNFIYVEQNTTISSPKDNKNAEYMIILADITQQIELERRSITDPLTKLYNRARIDQFLTRETQLAKRHKNSLCVIMLDIDYFKKINDVYGHQVGDMVLVELAKILKNHIRSTDLAGRFGGEEFILILPQTNQEGGLIVAQEIRKKIEAYNFSVQSKITASFGVASFKHEDDIHTLIKRADQALYQAKANGRNRVCC